MKDEDQAQLCLPRNKHCCIIVHVDDVMFCGDGTLLGCLPERFETEVLHLPFAVGSEIQFLKRTLRRVSSGLVLLPGTSIAKVIHSLEAILERHVRKQFPVTAPSKQRI